MGKEKGRWSERRGRKEEVKETLSLGKFLRASMLQQRRRERSRQVERKKTKVKGLSMIALNILQHTLWELA